MQKKYELVAESVINSLDGNPGKSGIKLIIEPFKVNQVENDELKLKNNKMKLKTLVIRKFGFGMYRIFSLERYFIYFTFKKMAII